MSFFTFLKGRKGKVNVCFFSPFLNTFLTLPVSIGKTVKKITMTCLSAPLSRCQCQYVKQ